MKVISLSLSAIRSRSRAIALAFLFALPGAVLAVDNPIDPFDYNFCGGERVYPVVGVEFATVCGPRNMVAVGRRGKLSWFFPDTHGSGQGNLKGSYQLSDKQLLQLSRIAEVVQIAAAPTPEATPVQYKLGLNFSGRHYRRVHTGVTEKYSPSSLLFKSILELVPDHPYLPECTGKPLIFDPILTRSQRLKIHGNVKQKTAALQK